ncbi:cysteine--tRNA ligase [Candidatus Bathycorpusculum sp.]|uniref:cysteine--tRNA ligase n=1 Tax=Candidatus Bathycorpusculum sp. TaxID=2994959 RepID=UPI002820707A|nr:cysteine--tRNA ligase [Candidatus Termitimicrobium sp.]MCL2432841.1 cysteine--tRNA ligase [Candidatus Termitimicrobium sp.]
MTAKPSTLHIYNTLTRKKQEFTPLTPGHIKLYTCGPTVYDYAHIGNFRAFLFEDLLKRWLKYHNYKVTHIMNLTDIDDKTIKGSQTKAIPLKQFTEFYIKAFFEDIKTLNIQPADHYPKATDHIPEMVTLIKTLLVKNIAYKSEDGSIYFSVTKFSNYGKLAHIKINELKTGARVNQDEYAKEEAQDFALWKAWTPQDGQVYWQTELGKGRPGWHIECSAMSMKYLGETFDIHCGGVDNMFPHHENEIAQSEAATNKKFAIYWMHNEHLQVEGKKMSKRLGNFYTLRDLLSKGYDPIAIRYLLISTHYRQQFNFTFEGLQSATTTIERLRNFARRLQKVETPTTDTDKPATLTTQLQEQFNNAMDDDLNITIALAHLFEFIREFNSLLDANLVNKTQATKTLDLIMQLDTVLGVIGKIEPIETLPSDIDTLVQKREDARKAKNWREADAIRDQLKTMGIILEDTTQGIKWYRKKT